jgi:hypothetical protein
MANLLAGPNEDRDDRDRLCLQEYVEYARRRRYRIRKLRGDGQKLGAALFATAAIASTIGRAIG